MKKLLALLLVMVLAVASMASCTPTDAIDTVKDTTSDVFNTVKKTVGGWFGIEFEEENNDNNNADNAGNNNQGGTTTPDNKTDAQYAVTQINSLYKNLDAKTGVRDFQFIFYQDTANFLVMPIDVVGPFDGESVCVGSQCFDTGQGC